MKSTEWKSLIQNWTGMNEDQWKVRQRFLKVSSKADNWRKKEIDLLFSVMSPFSSLGIKTMLMKGVDPNYEPSFLEMNQLTLENTLIQQDFPKEKYLSQELIDLLNYKSLYSTESLKIYGQVKIGQVCLDRWKYLLAVKSKHHEKLNKLQVQYGISGICPNVVQIIEDTLIYPFLSPEFAETPDESSLILIPSDLLILNDWKWTLTDKFLTLAFKYDCNLYWRDKSVQSFSIHGELKEITPTEILNLVPQYDKAEITETFENDTNPYFMFCVSTGLTTGLDNTLEIYALLDKKKPSDIIF